MRIHSPITFLYYHDVAAASRFYEDVMGFELVVDQGWAKVYRVSPGAYLGVVDGAKGFFKAQDKSAVLLTLVVDDVFAWQAHLKSKGVKILREAQERPEIQIRCLYCEDSGGYAIEIQQFLDPDTARRFGAE